MVQLTHVRSNEHPLGKLVGGHVGSEDGQVLHLAKSLLVVVCTHDDAWVVLSDVVVCARLLVDPTELHY